MLPGDMGRTGRQWNVISEPYPGLRGYATAYSWNPLRKGLLTGIYVLPNSSRFFSMRFTPLNSRIFLHLNPKSHLLSNLKGRRLQIYLRPFSWLILRLQTRHPMVLLGCPKMGHLPGRWGGKIPPQFFRSATVATIATVLGVPLKTPSRPLRASRFTRLLQTQVLPPPCRSAGYAVRRAWFCSRTSPDALPATVWHSHSDV